MTDTDVLLDPTAELSAGAVELAERPGSLEGLTVGLLDITKARGDVFLERVDELLRERGLRTRRYAKPTFTKPAPLDLRQEIAQHCHLVIEALAD